MARRRSYNYNYYPEYVPVSVQQTRNAKAAKALKGARPVVVQGTAIAKSWWGKSWNANLERYADYSNRIGRGRSYVRHGAVLDLRVEVGKAVAVVQGSRARPYEIEISVAKLSDHNWEQIRQAALERLDSLADMLAGKFPEKLKETFFAEGSGLFPSPKEIKFACSCPDWASMCKHVAAALYGIGNRLDNAPELLFTLRQVDMQELISRAIAQTTSRLIDQAEIAVGDDIIADSDLEDIFGIEFDDSEPVAKPAKPVKSAKPAAKAPATTKSAKPAVKRAKLAKLKLTAAKPVKPVKPAKPAAATTVGAPRHGHMTSQIATMAAGFDGEFSAPMLLPLMPGWTIQQIALTLNRAVAEGKVRKIRHGIYKGK